MTIDIWDKCNGKKHIKIINEITWRIVALQEKTATRKLVDSLEEQKMLDDLIEKSKPPIPLTHSKFHPLLYTPFRYPPLKNGSRFGKKEQPSIWYGSLAIETAIAEKAYYQMSFIRGSTAHFGIISLAFTLFSVKVATDKGIKLTESPFLKYKNMISSPTNYKASQLLGLKIREEKIDGFTFHSARDPNKGINIGLFSTAAFADKNPSTHSFQTWQCTATDTLVEFVRSDPVKDQALSFPMANFLVDGKLPFPAN